MCLRFAFIYQFLTFRQIRIRGYQPWFQVHLVNPRKWNTANLIRDFHSVFCLPFSQIVNQPVSPCDKQLTKPGSKRGKTCRENKLPVPSARKDITAAKCEKSCQAREIMLTVCHKAYTEGGKICHNCKARVKSGDPDHDWLCCVRD